MALHQAMAGKDIVEEQTQTITATVTSLEFDLESDQPTITAMITTTCIDCLIVLLALREGQRICQQGHTNDTRENISDKEDSHLSNIQPSCHSFSRDN